MMTSDDDERGLMKQDDDVDEYDGGERDAQCHEVEQEEFQFTFCLIIKYFTIDTIKKKLQIYIITIYLEQTRKF